MRLFTRAALASSTCVHPASRRLVRMLRSVTRQHSHELEARGQNPEDEPAQHVSSLENSTVAVNPNMSNTSFNL